MDAGPIRDLLTALAGLFTGALSGAFGVGGAVISTPAIRALGVPASLAIGTTLPSIFPSAAAGALRYRREGLIDRQAVLLTIPVGLAASVAGAVLSELIPGEGRILMLLTAVLLGITSVRMVRAAPSSDEADRSAAFEERAPGTDTSSSDRRADATCDRAPGDPKRSDPKRSDPKSSGFPDEGSAHRVARIPAETGDPAPEAPHHGRASPAAFAVVGGVAGLLSGLLGVGGGIVMVPGFTQVAGLSIKSAIATSLVCVAAFAVPGTVTHALLGNIDWRAAAFLTLTVIPGSRLGAAATMRASDRTLRLVVAGLLGVVALLYAGGELAGLVG